MEGQSDENETGDAVVEWKVWLENELKRDEKATIYSLATAETTTLVETLSSTLHEDDYRRTRPQQKKKKKDTTTAGKKKKSRAQQVVSVVVKPRVRHVVHRSFLPTFGTKAHSVILQTTTDIRTPKVDQLLGIHPHHRHYYVVDDDDSDDDSDDDDNNDIGDNNILSEKRDGGLREGRKGYGDDDVGGGDHSHYHHHQSTTNIPNQQRSSPPSPPPSSRQRPLPPTAEIAWWFPTSRIQFRLLARSYILSSPSTPASSSSSNKDHRRFPVDLAGRPLIPFASAPSVMVFDGSPTGEGKKVDSDNDREKSDGKEEEEIVAGDASSTSTSATAGISAGGGGIDVGSIPSVATSTVTSTDDTPAHAFQTVTLISGADDDDDDGNDDFKKDDAGARTKNKHGDKGGVGVGRESDKSSRGGGGGGSIMTMEDWEQVRVEAFDALSPGLRASFARPYIPGSILLNPEEAKEWPMEIEIGPVEVNREGKGKGKEKEKIGGGREEAMRGGAVGEGRIYEAYEAAADKSVEDEDEEKKRALENFAVVYLDVEEVDVVDLGRIPNERYRYRKVMAVEGDRDSRVVGWTKDVLVP